MDKVEIWVLDDGETWTDIEPTKLVLQTEEQLGAYRHCRNPQGGSAELRDIIEGLILEDRTGLPPTTLVDEDGGV